MKTLCKKKKKKKLGLVLEQVADATHQCRKCGRVCSKKKKLCKPRKLGNSASLAKAG